MRVELRIAGERHGTVRADVGAVHPLARFAQRGGPADHFAAPHRLVAGVGAVPDAADLDAPVLAALRVDHAPDPGRSLDRGEDRMPFAHSAGSPFSGRERQATRAPPTSTERTGTVGVGHARVWG